jgi:formate dehydrogenase major subunit
MQADGKGWLYAPSGLLDGPMPAHYEPHESPVEQPALHGAGQPDRQDLRRKDNLSNPSRGAGRSLPVRLHDPTGSPSTTPPAGMSRWVPYLAELQPEMFCEVSPELGRERGLEHLGYATIVTARTAIEGARCS